MSYTQLVKGWGGGGGGRSLYEDPGLPVSGI